MRGSHARRRAARPLALAAALLAGGAVTASAASSPGFKPDPGLSTATATPAPLPLITVGTGKNPSLIVDAAGTAHIAFTEDGGATSPDTLVVCNLPRGQKACSPLATAPTPQAPDSSEGGVFSGNFPAGNHDTDGAVPLAIENQLYLVERRFPDAFQTPDGSTNGSNVFEWQSANGGQTITGPAIIGDNQMAGGAITYGNPAAPSIGTISRLQTEGTFFQGTAPGAYAGDEKAQLGSADQDVAGGLAPDMSGAVIRPVAAYADNNGNTYVREWSGQGDINNVSSWSPPTTVSGYSPEIVGGPAGVFLLTSSSDIGGGTMTLHKIVGGAVSGSGVSLGTSMSTPAISENASGELSYAYTDANGVEDETSSDGASFSAAQLAAAVPSGAGVGHLVADATSDGGGYVSFVENQHGAEGIGTVVAAAFGTQAATQRPGFGQQAGGGVGSAVGDQLASSSCSSATFGDVDAEIYPRYSACFVPDSRDPNMSVTLGTVDVNGLLLIPDKGTRIGIDAKLHKIQTSGPVSVALIANGVTSVIFHGVLDYVVGDAGAGGHLFSPSLNGAGFSLLGFPLAGIIDPKLTKGGLNIAVTLKLPNYLGGITATANMTATSFTGLALDSVHFSVGDIDVGALEIKNLNVAYAKQGNVWMGSGQLLVPAGGAGLNFGLSVEFDNGQWVDGRVDFLQPYPGDAAGGVPATYLSRGSLDLNFQHGTTLTGDVTLGTIPLPSVGTPEPHDFFFSNDASVSANFRTPVTLTLSGDTYLSGFPIGSEKLTWQLPDNFSFDGMADIELGPVKITGDIGGEVEPSYKEYGAHIVATGSLFNFTIVRLGVAVNQDGFGVAIGWGGVVCYWASGCHPVFIGDTTSRFINPPLQPALSRRAHVAALASIVVPRHAPSVDIDVAGVGGAPSVVLVSPTGKTLTPTLLTSTTLPAGARAVAVTDTADKATDVGLVKPQAGTWHVMQTPGSSTAIASVQYAIGEKSPTARARVSGAGYRRVLHYHVGTPADTAVTFVEQTSRLTHVIGTAKGRSGAIVFTPADGPAGKRRIVAELTNNGAPIKNVAVATYSAPPPLTPGSARHLRVSASPRAFSYSYAPPANAAQVLVTIVTSDGRRIDHLVSRRTHRGTVTVQGRPDAVTVRVLGIAADGRRGPAVTAKAKLAAKVKARRHKK